MRRLAALSLLAVLALTGCASAGVEPETSPTVEPSATPEATPEATEESGTDARGATYASLEEMRVDLEAAGVTCPTLVNRDQNPNASETGTCDDYIWLLSTFDGIDARNLVLQLNVDSLEPGTFLVGPN